MRRTMVALFIALALALAAVFHGMSGPNTAVEVTVMTRNIYVGAEIDRLLAAPAHEIPALAAELWQDVVESDFPGRAVALADEIAAAEPHLIGLQEVSLFRVQSPGDFLTGNAEAASDTALDYLAVLLDELAARGVSYRVVAVATNFDVEVPVATVHGLDDIRLTDRDVLLARADVVAAESQERNFSTNLQAPLGGDASQLLTVYRGWTAVYATVDGVTLLFVNTHLEPPERAPAVQASQALELRAELEAVDLPIILVGDLNSTADGSSTETYADFLAAGYGDAWAGGGGLGKTCCHAVDLMNPTPDLTKRIDYILYRGNLETALAELVGDEVSDRTAAGLWPSDHAGVVATLSVR